MVQDSRKENSKTGTLKTALRGSGQAGIAAPEILAGVRSMLHPPTKSAAGLPADSPGAARLIAKPSSPEEKSIAA